MTAAPTGVVLLKKEQQNKKCCPFEKRNRKNNNIAASSKSNGKAFDSKICTKTKQKKLCKNCEKR